MSCPVDFAAGCLRRSFLLSRACWWRCHRLLMPASRSTSSTDPPHPGMDYRQCHGVGAGPCCVSGVRLLHAYLTRDGGVVPPDAKYGELTEGNVLTSDAIAGMLAKLRGRAFNQVLDELPKRDEGYPPAAAATPTWDTAVERLKHVHIHGWEAARPQL